MLLRRSAASLIGCALVLCACGGPGEPDAGADAGRDGGRDSGARDAGRDGGRDAGHDGGPDDPGWEPLAGLPSLCVIERASHPERIWQPDWETCPSPPDGCVRTVGDTAHRDVVFTSSAWHDGSATYFEYAFPAQNWRNVVVTNTSGERVGAWRFPEPVAGGIDVCSIQSLGIGDGAVAFAVLYYNSRVPERNTELLFHAPFDRLTTMVEPTALLTGDRFIAAGNYPQRLAVSRDLVAMEMQPGAFIALARGPDVQILEGGAITGLPAGLATLGDAVVWEDWGARTRLLHGATDVTPAILLDADPAQAFYFDTDGSIFAWLQGYDRQPDGTYATLELWTAPATADPSLLAPRMVRALDTQIGPSAAGGSWFVMLRDPPRRLEVTSLLDGTQRQWVPLGYALPEGPICVSENEILIETITVSGPTLVRLDPHSLPLVE